MNNRISIQYTNTHTHTHTHTFYYAFGRVKNKMENSILIQRH
jgi:hypothetical protein